MATKDFIDLVTKVKYVAGGRCRYNGVNSRQWARYQEQSGCWVFQGANFHPISATRAEISGQCGNLNAKFSEA